MAKKRVSMRGMGADAFFNPPSEEKEEPVTQDEGLQVNQQADKTVPHLSVLPANQLDSTSVKQQTSVPPSQDTTIPVKQSTESPAKQHASMPVTEVASPRPGQHTDMPDKQYASKATHQHAGPLTKATYYIYPDQDLKLERIRLARRVRGERVDKSELIREAIDKLVE